MALAVNADSSGHGGSHFVAQDGVHTLTVPRTETVSREGSRRGGGSYKCCSSEIDDDISVPSRGTSLEGSRRSGNAYRCCTEAENGSVHSKSGTDRRAGKAPPAASGRAQSGCTEPDLEAHGADPHGADPHSHSLDHSSHDQARPPPKGVWGRFSWLIRTYFSKWRGGEDTALPVPAVDDLFISWVGAFLGILAVSGLSQLLTPAIAVNTLIASFGASAVLVFGVIESKLAQPRNFIGGQVLSAVVGCTTRLVLKDVLWLSGPIGMSLALLAMQVTKTTHPPGGASALIAASVKHHDLPGWAGYKFVLAVLIGSLAMQLVALVVNNLHHKRRYPTYWWGTAGLLW